MILSRWKLTQRAVRDRSTWRALADPYQVHRTVWGMFADGPDRRRDFLFRWEPDVASPGGQGSLWTLADREPELTGDAWSVESKRLEPVLRTGDRLSFKLRVNPVVKRKGKRHDVVMDAKKQIGAARDLSTAEIEQTALEAWWQRRAPRWGFRPVDLRTEGYRVWRFHKPDKNSKISLGTCNLAGQLEVLDSALFLDQWRRGFGPAKGFGCGLMLIARR